MDDALAPEEGWITIGEDRSLMHNAEMRWPE